LTRIDTPQRETGHWRFDESSGDADDAGPFDLDGTLTNGASFDTGNRAPNSGSGGSLKLNLGSSDVGHPENWDDYVSMGDQDELKIADHDLTFSVWFKTSATGVMRIVGQGNPYNTPGSGLPFTGANPGKHGFF
jgi:hypothetical protein